MSFSTTGVARIAEANMKRWLERERIAEKVDSKKSPLDLGPYISISRQCGAGGEEIAAHVSKQLNWDLIDREILEKIAEDFDVSTQLVDHIDEKHVSWLSELFETWIGKKRFNQEAYVHDLSRLMMIAAQHGKFVVVGRGSQYILPRKFGLFVRLHAPFDHRVSEIARTTNISESEASKVVAKTDKERAGFLKSIFQHNGEDPDSYDLVINTSSFDAEQTSQLIIDALEMKT